VDDARVEIGRFSVERKLGAGGTGVVYAAWDRERDARVALKTLRQLDADALYRLKREFRSLADVKHPNLVDTYELMSAGDHWFLTMELVEGTTFLAYVRPDGRLDLTRLRSALQQLAAGVQALHDSGHLHRDLKPSNVLVTATGRVAICDFGLVTEVTAVRLRHTIEDCLAGTLAYLSPEQAALLPLTEASDWYSVGVILYEALTGRLPVEGTRQEVLARKQMLEPSPPSAGTDDVPPDLDVLCRELLAIAPERRPRGPDVLLRLGSAPQPVSTAPVFVGRRRELASLAEAQQAAAAGPVVVMLHGPPGAGKTALARRFLEEVGATRGALILSGRCSERESVPYNAVDEILDDLSAWLAQSPDAERFVDGAGSLARLFPVLKRVPAVTESLPWELTGVAANPGALRAEAFDAFRSVLGRLARHSQLVLWIDDLQWADQDSMALLAHALRTTDAPPVLLVATARDEEDRLEPLLATLAAGADVRRVNVGTLTDDESQALAASLLPNASAQAKAVVARESRGNPLFAQQLAGYVESAAGDAMCAAGLTLEQVLGTRLHQLPAQSRRLLETVAVAGGRVARRVAGGAAQLCNETEAHAVAGLREARLLRVSGTARGERLECFHDRVCEIVLAELAPTALAETHARLATALLRTDDPDPEMLVRHFSGAHDHERAARFAVAAADQAARALAFDRAVRLYQLARVLRAWSAGAARELDEKLAAALCNAGRGADAARAYLALAADAAPADAMLYQRRAAEQLLRSGLVEQGIDVARDVLARVGLSLAPTPRRALLSCVARRGALWLRGLEFRHRDPSLTTGRDLAQLEVCWSMAVGLGLVDVVRGFDFHTQHLQLALRTGDPARVLRALALEACHLSAGGTRTAPRVRRLLARIEPLADRVATPEARAWAAAAAGSAAALSGRFRDGLTSCERAVALFRRECTGVFWEVSSMELFSLWCLLYQGRLRDLSERVPRLIEQADERGDAFSSTNLRTGWPAMRWLAADDPDAGRGEVAAAMASWVRGPFHMQHYYELLALSHFDLYTGDIARAWSRLDERWASLRRSRVFSIQNVRIGLGSLRGRLALAHGDVVEARRAAVALDHEGAAWARALADLLRAGCAQADHDDEQCVAALARAEAQFADAGMELHVHVARARRGEQMGGADGRALRDEAAAWMQAEGIRRPEQMIALWTPGFA
jgi:eukaryotic-like serine/threonine-protein kinase